MTELETLKYVGLARMPYDDRLGAAVEDAMRSWKAFCRLDSACKQQLSIGNAAMPIGYRNDGSPDLDTVAEEHVDVPLGRILELYKAAQRSGTDEIRRLVAHIGVVIEMLGSSVMELSRAVSVRFGLNGLEPNAFEREIGAGRETCVLRFRHHQQNPIATTAARERVARGGFVLHMAETRPGTAYLNRNTQWHGFVIPPRHAIVMAGMELQHRSLCGLIATWTRDDAMPIGSSRHSLTCDIPLVHAPHLIQVGTEPALLVAGFNYRMTQENFRALFSRT